jgi:hypothetical protein
VKEFIVLAREGITFAAEDSEPIPALDVPKVDVSGTPKLPNALDKDM